LKSQIVSFLALQPAAALMEYASVSAMRLSGYRRNITLRSWRTVQKNSTTIISDASGFLPTQNDDWHDVSGHHRYYGAAASR
jgi:hypothetical protein